MLGPRGWPFPPHNHHPKCPPSPKYRSKHPRTWFWAGAHIRDQGTEGNDSRRTCDTSKTNCILPPQKKGEVGYCVSLNDIPVLVGLQCRDKQELDVDNGVPRHAICSSTVDVWKNTRPLGPLPVDQKRDEDGAFGPGPRRSRRHRLQSDRVVEADREPKALSRSARGIAPRIPVGIVGVPVCKGERAKGGERMGGRSRAARVFLSLGRMYRDYTHVNLKIL